jgi:putative heme-binding domain-containing protein
VALAAAILLLTSVVSAQETAKTYTQVPAIASSVSSVGPIAGTEQAASVAGRKLLAAGPTPEWIWGPDANQKYVLRTEFTGGSQSAWLQVAADNQATVWINRRRITTNDNWQAAELADVQSAIRPGNNTLYVEVENSGGPSGLVLKLALTDPAGQTRYVVSDATWKAAASREATEFAAVTSRGKLGTQPWGDAFAESEESTARDVFQTLPGFQVEKLFTVPKNELGSWVCLTTDDRGRLLVSDQDGKGLCRVTPSPIGSQDETKVERLDVNITAAQGMLYAFGSLYLSVNGGPGSGLYRARDTNGDDQFDEVVQLKAFRGGGEHGPHGLRLSPDGKSIVIVAGNHTLPPFEPQRNAGPQTMGGPRAEPLVTSLAAGESSRIPTNWDEDVLLPRQWDANGHAAGILAPGGWIAQTDPEGKTWELLSVGYRNQYDLAFNADGELFTYDSDMEWDLGSPWYVPTRVSHATSGSEFGWRSGTARWPAYYADSLPALVDIGPGSPVGVEFGYGTKFPAKYQRALYLCDWTFGTMYAIHIAPDGSSYKGVKEEFLSRSPLPLTDATVGQDGALYFTVGGRGTQSELFRVTYVGTEPTAPVDAKDSTGADLRALRHKLEAFHQRAENPSAAVDLALQHLGHSDRFLRYAARIALENQPIDAWRDRVLTPGPVTQMIHGAIAVARQGARSDGPRVLEHLQTVFKARLLDDDWLGLLRAYQLTFIRLDEPSEEVRLALLQQLDSRFPMSSDAVNRELCNVLVYLKSPTILAKATELLKQPPRPTITELGDLLSRNRGYGGTINAMNKNAPDQQQIHYAFALRNVKTGWTLDQRKAYFGFLEQARGWSGGASFVNFLKNIDRDAFENAPEPERLAIEASGARKPFVVPELPKPDGPGRPWTLAEVVALGGDKLQKGRNFKNGQKMFAATRCVICHRFAGDGGATGPDLTQLAGRFNLKDLTEAIVDPSKVISDQYRAVAVQTSSGKSYTGKVVSETTEKLVILINPEDATKVVEVLKSDIEAQAASPVSMMPKDLLNQLNEQEVLDLLAYLLSRGNPGDAMFRK